MIVSVVKVVMLFLKVMLVLLVRKYWLDMVIGDDVMLCNVKSEIVELFGVMWKYGMMSWDCVFWDVVEVFGLSDSCVWVLLVRKKVVRRRIGVMLGREEGVIVCFL